MALDTVERIQQISRVYRLLLSSVLLLLYFATSDSLLIRANHENLYLLTSLIWLALVIFSTLGRLITRQDFLIETSANYIIDFVAISILAYACGGVESGLLYLTLPMIAMAGLEVPSRLSLLIAVTATLGELIVEFMVSLESVTAETYFFQAGLLGTTLFLVSLGFNLAQDWLRTAEAEVEKSTRTA